jgi:hypothetical protein
MKQVTKRRDKNIIIKKIHKDLIILSINIKRSNIFFNITTKKGNTLQKFTCGSFQIKNSRKRKPIIRADVFYFFGLKVKEGKIKMMRINITNRKLRARRMLRSFKRLKLKVLKSFKIKKFSAFNGCPKKNKKRRGGKPRRFRFKVRRFVFKKIKHHKKQSLLQIYQNSLKNDTKYSSKKNFQTYERSSLLEDNYKLLSSKLFKIKNETINNHMYYMYVNKLFININILHLEFNFLKNIKKYFLKIKLLKENNNNFIRINSFRYKNKILLHKIKTVFSLKAKQNKNLPYINKLQKKFKYNAYIQSNLIKKKIYLLNKKIKILPKSLQCKIKNTNIYVSMYKKKISKFIYKKIDILLIFINKIFLIFKKLKIFYFLKMSFFKKTFKKYKTQIFKKELKKKNFIYKINKINKKFSIINYHTFLKKTKKNYCLFLIKKFLKFRIFLKKKFKKNKNLNLLKKKIEPIDGIRLKITDKIKFKNKLRQKIKFNKKNKFFNIKKKTYSFKELFEKKKKKLNKKYKNITFFEKNKHYWFKKRFFFKNNTKQFFKIKKHKTKVYKNVFIQF